MKRSIMTFLILCILFGFSTVFSQTIGLEQVIREVCAKSDSSAMMQESVKKSRQMVREKWSNVYPTITGSLVAAKNYGSLFSGSSGGSSQSSHSLAKEASNFTPKDSGILANVETMMQSLGSLSAPQTTNIYSAGLQISQPIYTFGKVGTAIKAAEQYDESSVCTYKRNMQSLQLQALDAFSHAVLAREAEAVSERSLGRKKEMHEFLDRNFTLGSGSKAQVLSTKADMLKQSSGTLIAKRDAYTARMNLNAFMGRPLFDSTALDTVSMLDKILRAPIPREDDAVRAALSERMDLKSFKLMEESNRGAAKIYRAMYLPSIGAQGSAGYSKYESGSQLLQNNGSASWTVGIGLQWTLFDGFSNSAKAAQFTSDANKLEFVFNTMLKMVEIEIRSDIAECAAADSNYAASKEMLGAARESYDLTMSNFKQGSGQLSDLQHVDDLLQQAELGLTDARYRLVRSRAALLVAMGSDIVKIN